MLIIFIDMDLLELSDYESELSVLNLKTRMRNENNFLIRKDRLLEKVQGLAGRECFDRNCPLHHHHKYIVLTLQRASLLMILEQLCKIVCCWRPSLAVWL
jgi:hypothetical protein